MYLEECGVIRTEEGDFQKIFGVTGEGDDGIVELYYNDEPFAIVCLTGMKGLNVVSVEEFGVEMKDLVTAISLGSRGAGVIGLVTLADGLFVIKSTYPVKVSIQPRKYDGTEKECTEYIDVAEVEGDIPEYSDLCEVMNIF